MIGLLQGTPSDFGKSTILIKTRSGVGYTVCVSNQTKNTTLSQETCTLYIHTNIGKDSVQLFGFIEQEEYSVFQLLLQVSGIGPKKAINIIERIPTNTLLEAISKEDPDIFITFGINRKQAMRIILDIGKKINYTTNSNAADVITALIGLGYNKKETLNVVKQIDTNKPIEKQIQQALKLMR